MWAARGGGGGGGFSALAVKDKKKSSKDKEGKDKDKDKVCYNQRNIPYLLSFTLTSLTVLCSALLCCVFLLHSTLIVAGFIFHSSYLKYSIHHSPSTSSILISQSSLLPPLLSSSPYLPSLFMALYHRNPKRKIRIKRVRRAVSSLLRVRKNLPQPLPQLLWRRRVATR